MLQYHSCCAGLLQSILTRITREEQIKQNRPVRFKYKTTNVSYCILLSDRAAFMARRSRCEGINLEQATCPVRRELSGVYGLRSQAVGRILKSKCVINCDRMECDSLHIINHYLPGILGQTFSITELACVSGIRQHFTQLLAGK